MAGCMPNVSKNPGMVCSAGTSSARPSPASIALRDVKAAIPSKLRLCARHASTSGYDATSCVSPLFVLVAQMRTSRSEAGKGSGRSSTALTTLKMAVLAPMPSPRVRTATIVKVGFRRSMRAPTRASWST